MTSDFDLLIQRLVAEIPFPSPAKATEDGLIAYGGDLQPELNRMTKEGKWPEMSGKITDEMLDTIGVSGTPYDAGCKLRLRNQFGARTSPVLYNETDPEAVADLLRGLKDGA